MVGFEYYCLVVGLNNMLTLNQRKPLGNYAHWQRPEATPASNPHVFKMLIILFINFLSTVKGSVEFKINFQEEMKG